MENSGQRAKAGGQRGGCSRFAVSGDRVVMEVTRSQIGFVEG